MQGITIEHAAPADAEAMLEVYYQGWLVTYPNAEYGITVEDIEDRYKTRKSEERLVKRREQIAHPPEGETILVAKKDTTVIGVCAVVQHSDRNQLQSIYVLPEFHGKGVSLPLWSAAQKYLDPSKPTIVEVATYNKKAIRFYEKLGFLDTGKRMTDPKFTMKSGAVIPEMEMRREAIS